MRKTVLFVMIVCFIISSFSVFAYADNTPKDISGEVNTDVSPLYEVNDCKLIVNGKEISDYNEYVKIYYDDDGFIAAQIPLFTVIKALGGKVIWLGKNAIIIHSSGIFFYDSEAVRLTRFPVFDRLIPEKSAEEFEFFISGYNLLINPLAGGKGVYDKFVLDRELIVNVGNSANGWLKANLSLKLKIDIDEKTIYIENDSIPQRIIVVLKEAAKDFLAE